MSSSESTLQEVSTQSQPRRMISRVLARAPWSTRVISERAFLRGVVDADHSMAPFFERLQHFEDTLFSSRVPDVIQQRNVLKLQLVGSPATLTASTSQLSEGNYRGWNQRLTATTAYRLADVIAYVDGVDIQNVPRYKKEESYARPRSLDALWARLGDWPRILRNFKAEPLGKPDGPVGDLKPHITLSKWLAYFTDQTKISKIMTNLLGAAMHLSLIRGLGDPPPKACDELMSRHRVVEGSWNGDNHLSNGEAAIKERMALYLALFFSPICLLIPTVLSKKTVAGKNMIEIFQALGNCKPPALVSVERAIWKTLFNLADGTLQPNEILTSLVDSIPWNEIEATSPQDRAWFSLPCQILPTLDTSTLAPTGAEHILLHDSSASGPLHNDGDKESPGHGAETPAPSVLTLLSPDPMSTEDSVVKINSAHETFALEGLVQCSSDEDNPGGAETQAPSVLALTRRRKSTPTEDLAAKINYTYNTSTSEGLVQDGREEESTEGSVGRAHIGSPASNDMDLESESDLDNEMKAGNLLGQSGMCSLHSLESFPTIPTGSRKRKSVKLKNKHRPQIHQSDNLKKRKRGNTDVEIPQLRRPIYIIDLTNDLEEEDPQPQAILPSITARVLGDEMSFHDVNGDARNIKPAFHYQTYLDNFIQLVKAAKSRDYEGLPLYLTNPDQSSIRVMSETEFESSSTSEIQAIFKKKHIVVTSQNFRCSKFNLEALRKIAWETKPLCVNDLSAEVTDHRMVKATFQDVLHHANDEQGRALNTLDLPMHDGVSIPAALSSERWSWQHTINKKLCKASDRFPTSAMSWASVSTSGTHSPWHLDAEGLCTMIQIQNEEGLKIWFVGVERKGCKSFSGLTTFLGDWDADAPNTERWDVEAIVLTPGAKLFMRPNTPQWVYTPANTICYGGHFYTTATIRESCYGLMHSFIAHRLLTNTSHEAESRELLRRVITYYHSAFIESPYPDPTLIHIMDILSFNGLMDFLTLFNAAELFNVLYAQYKGDVSMRDRLSFVEARRLGRIVLAWLSDNYRIFTGEHQEISVGALQQKYFRGQVRALLRYKYLEERNLTELNDKQKEPHYIGFAELSNKVRCSIADGSQILQEYHQLLKENPSDHYFEDLSWPSSERYELRPRVGRLESSRAGRAYSHINGLTPADKDLEDIDAAAPSPSSKRGKLI